MALIMIQWIMRLVSASSVSMMTTNKGAASDPLVSLQTTRLALRIPPCHNVLFIGTYVDGTIV